MTHNIDISAGKATLLLLLLLYLMMAADWTQRRRE